MKKFCLLFLSSVFLFSNVIEFEKTDIEVSNENGFFVFSPEGYIKDSESLSVCMFKPIEGKKDMQLFCMGKFNPVGKVGVLNAELKDGKIIVHEPLVEIKNINLKFKK